MSAQELAEIVAELASGYPENNKVPITKEFESVVKIVLPHLARRASSARDKGVTNITEIWQFIREDSETLFGEALDKVERVKVIYVASKFMNNKLIGEMITKQALEITRDGRKN